MVVTTIETQTKIPKAKFSTCAQDVHTQAHFLPSSLLLIPSIFPLCSPLLPPPLFSLSIDSSQFQTRMPETIHKNILRQMSLNPQHLASCTFLQSPWSQTPCFLRCDDKWLVVIQVLGRLRHKDQQFKVGFGSWLVKSQPGLQDIPVKKNQKEKHCILLNQLNS